MEREAEGGERDAEAREVAGSAPGTRRLPSLAPFWAADAGPPTTPTSTVSRCLTGAVEARCERS